MRRKHLYIILLMVAVAAALPLRAEELTGTTLHIRQEMSMGDFSNDSELDAWFAGMDKFRVEGTVLIKQMELLSETITVSDGEIVKQMLTTPMGPIYTFLDLKRIRKALPELDYSPAKTFSPLAYQDMLSEKEEKVSLGMREIDGVQTQGWEIPLEQGRNSLPSNVPVTLPDPAKLRIWVGVDDGIARCVEMSNAEGETFLKTIYTKVNTHALIPAEKLVLEIPEGAEPKDITDVVLGGIVTTRVQPEQPEANAKSAGPAAVPQE